MLVVSYVTYKKFEKLPFGFEKLPVSGSEEFISCIQNSKFRKFELEVRNEDF
jgi:hypothetical protein